MSKRILSLALVVMMLAAFVPSTMFMASAAADRYYYDFSTTYMVNKSSGHIKSAESFELMTYENTKGLWEYYMAGGPNGDTFASVDPSYDGVMAGSYCRRYPSATVGDWVAYKVSFPTDGKYTITYASMKHASYNKGATLEGYLLPADADLSKIDTALANPVARLATEEGEYAIGCQTNTAASFVNETENSNVGKGGISLNAGEYIFLLKVIEGTSLNTGFFTAFTTTTNKFSAAVSAPVGMEEGQTATASVKVYGLDSGAEIDTAEGTITYSSSNPAVAEVDPTTGVITAKAGGKATINATFSGTETYTVGVVAGKTITVAPIGYKFRIAFGLDGAHEVEGIGGPSKAYNGVNIEYSANIKTVNHYAMTNGLWKYYADKGLSDSYGGMLAEGAQLSASGYTALKVNIPATSTYDVTFTARNKFSASDIVLLPGDTAAANIAAALEGEDAIVLFDDYAASAAGAVTKAENITIEKGEYVLVLTGSTWPKWLDFETDGAAKFADTYVGFVEDILFENEEPAEASSFIYKLSDGTRVTDGIEYAVTNEKIATVSGTTVTPAGAGSTTLTATVNGEGSIIPGNIKTKKAGYRFKWSFSNANMIDPETGAVLGTGYVRPERVTSYAHSMGMWKYLGNYALSSADGIVADGSLLYLGAYEGAYLAFGVKVPVSGTYNVELKTNGAHSAVDYIIVPKGTALGWTYMANIHETEGAVTLFEGLAAPTGVRSTINAEAPVELEAGEYILVLRASDVVYTTIRLDEIAFTEVGATDYKTTYVGEVDDIALEIGKSATITSKFYDAYEIKAYEGEVEYSITNDDVATIDGDTITIKDSGTAEINASIAGAAVYAKPGAVAVKKVGYRFKYNFSTDDVVSLPEAGIEPSKYDAEHDANVEYTYCMKSITDYALTKGTWKYFASNGITKYGGMTTGYTQITPSNENSDATNYMALKLNVPVSGTFDLEFSFGNTGTSRYYLLPGDTTVEGLVEAAAGEDKIVLLEDYSTGTLTSGQYKTEVIEDVELEKGEYILFMQSGSYIYMRPRTLTITTPDATEYAPLYIGAVDPMTFIEEGSKDANVRVYDAWTKEIYETDATFAIVDEEVATLEDGVVTAVALGETTLSATIDEAAYSIMPGVVSVVPKPIPVTGITLDKTTLDLVIGGKATITPVIEPEDASNKAVTWTTSNKDVAVVNKGIVTAIGVGEATITATTADGEFTAECVVTVSSEITIAAGAGEAKAGEEVVVPVTLSGNLGLAGLQITVTFADSLELTGVVAGEALAGLEFTAPEELGAASATLIWAGEEADASNGEIAVLTFKVSEDAEPGDYAVSITIDSATDAEAVDVNAKATAGSVTVLKAHLPGDVDGSEKLDTRDVMLIRRHLAGGYDVTINEAAADVDASGKIDTRDVMLIRRYLAGGYDVELK